MEMMNSYFEKIFSKEKTIVNFVRVLSLICILAAASAAANDAVWEFLQMLGCAVALWCASFQLNQLKRPIRSFANLFNKGEVITTLDYVEWLGFALFLFGSAGRILV